MRVALAAAFLVVACSVYQTQPGDNAGSAGMAGGSAGTGATEDASGSAGSAGGDDAAESGGAGGADMSDASATEDAETGTLEAGLSDVPPEVSCPTCGDGLVLHWKLDETSGMLAMDSSGHNLSGTYVSTTTAFPTPAPGVVPPSTASWDPASLAFLGAPRQALTIALAGANLDPLKPPNNFSISVWYKAQGNTLGLNGSEVVSMGDHYIVRLGRWSPGLYRLEFNKQWTASGTSSSMMYVQCYTAGAAVVSGTPSYLDGNWHHLAAIASSTAPGSAIYFDGVLQPCATFNNSQSATANVVYVGAGTDFWVGRHGAGKTQYDFQGNLDEVRFYNRVLSPAEIQALAHGAP